MIHKNLNQKFYKSLRKCTRLIPPVSLPSAISYIIVSSSQQSLQRQESNEVYELILNPPQKDIKSMETRYQGRWDVNMMTDYTVGH